MGSTQFGKRPAVRPRLLEPGVSVTEHAPVIANDLLSECVRVSDLPGREKLRVGCKGEPVHANGLAEVDFAGTNAGISEANLFAGDLQHVVFVVSEHHVECNAGAVPCLPHLFVLAQWGVPFAVGVGGAT